MTINKISLVSSVMEFVVNGLNKHIFLLGSYDVLVSSDCYNKLPQIKLLNTTKICSFTFLQARISKSRCQQGCTTPGGSRENLFFAFPSICGGWHSSACGHVIFYSASAFTLLSPVCIPSFSVTNLPLLFSCKDTCHEV